MKPGEPHDSSELTFVILEGDYSVHRLPPDSDVPDMAGDSVFYSITRTNEEITVVCPAAIDLNAEFTEPDWSVLKVAGPLDFSLIGVLAGISGALSHAKISLFALSTFDTDYILVKSCERERAIKALSSAGYRFTP